MSPILWCAAARPRRSPPGRFGGLLVLLGCLAVLMAGWAAPAHAQPPSGPVLPDPPSGTVTTPISGVTGGPCTEPGTPDQPVDGYNALLSGPGIFAPNATEGAPDGVVVVSTDDVGLSSTEPIRFTFRAPLTEIAAELGAPLLPGEYLLTFRCVNQFQGTVFQTYAAPFFLTGGAVADAYSATDPGPAAPGTAPSAPGPEASGGAGPTVVGLGAVLVLAAGVLTVVLLRRRRAAART